MTQMEKLEQTMAKDDAKLKELTRKFNEDSARLKEKISAEKKKYKELENAALLSELRSISASTGADTKKIIAAIKAGDTAFINQLLHDQFEKEQKERE